MFSTCLINALVVLAVGSMEIFPRGKVPGERSGEVGPEVCLPGTQGKDYGGGHDATCQNVTKPVLEPFLVDGADAAVVIAPGGGYHALSWDREGTDAARWLNSIGVSAFVLKYRVPTRDWLGRGMAPLMDAQRAVSFIRKSASSLGLNASRIGFMGFSAGGHLAAHLSISYASRAYKHIDAIDDLSCRPDFTLLIYPGFSLDQTLKDNITAKHPTTFIAQAEDDPFGAQYGLYYYIQLKEKEAPPSEVHIYQTGGHAYGLCSVRDAKGNVAALVKSTDPSGPPVMPAFVPYSEVCTWPRRLQRFLENLGLTNFTEAVTQVLIV